MLGQDRAVSPDPDDLPDGPDLKNLKGPGWALFEETTPDKKRYTKGPSKGKPMKNVVIKFPNGPATMTVVIPREAFVSMVRKYFSVKGY